MNTEKKGDILIGVTIVFVLVGPVLFSLPAMCDLFSLSDKGTIGDALGGITAPIIGLASIILLYWTLREQIRINIEQKKFNDVNRVLSMSSQITRMADDLRFGFSNEQGIVVGHGLSSIQILDHNKTNVGIAAEEFEQLFEKIQQLDNATTLLFLTLKDRSLSLDMNERQLMVDNLKSFLEKYSLFYGLVINSKIFVFPVINRHSSFDDDPLKKYLVPAKKLKNRVDNRIFLCNNMSKPCVL